MKLAPAAEAKAAAKPKATESTSQGPRSAAADTEPSNVHEQPVAEKQNQDNNDGANPDIRQEDKRKARSSAPTFCASTMQVFG